jgi:hypothetical protein
MRARLTAVIALVMVLVAYGVSPFVALFQLQIALEHGDAARLEQRIDWASVREGLKQDISDGIIGPVQTQLAGNSLPQFGASFMAGIANAMIEHDVTPQNLIAVMRQMRDGHQNETHPSLMHCLAAAAFDGPASVNVVVAAPGEDPEDGHLRLRLEFQHGTWRVVRAWIPQDMVERAAQRT